MNLPSKLILFVLIFKVSDGLKVSTRRGKITGGYEARPHSNPYIVSLQSRYLRYRYRICSGSILSQRWILTSGHCVTDSWAKRYAMDAIVGAHDLSKIMSSQIYPISHRIAHPMYRGGVGPYDIAMMRTSRKMQFSETVQPISLPTTTPTFSKNEDLLITGWGALQSTVFVLELPNKLRQAEVTYLPFNDCYRAVNGIKEKYEANPLKRRANICTGPISRGISGCTGDSGGPLVQYVSYSSGVDTTPLVTTTGKEGTTIGMTSTMSSTPVTTGKLSTTTTRASITTPSTTLSTTPETTTAATNTITTTTASNITAPTITAATTTAATFTKITTTEETSTATITTAPKPIIKPTVVGVLSWGVVPCGLKGAPTVYSNVTNYLDFINKYLQIS